MRGELYPILGFLSVVVLLTQVSESRAIVGHVPTYPGVGNAPTLIPQNGVILVARVNTAGTFLRTNGGEFDSVTSAQGAVVTGTHSTLLVPLGDTEKYIDVWRPDAPMPVGTYTAVGTDSDANASQQGTFEVVLAVDDLELRSFALDAPELSAQDVPAAQIQCGITPEGEPTSITTEFGIVPRVSIAVRTDAPGEVVSQYLFNVHDPDAETFLYTSYAPADLTLDRSTFVVTYSEPRPSYCVIATYVSLVTEAVVTLDPVCVEDDGTDWSATVAATEEQIDAELLDCEVPPPEFLSRYCALHAERGSLPWVCNEPAEQPEPTEGIEESPDAGDVDDTPEPGPNVPPSPPVGEVPLDMEPCPAMAEPPPTPDPTPRDMAEGSDVQRDASSSTADPRETRSTMGSGRATDAGEPMPVGASSEVDQGCSSHHRGADSRWWLVLAVAAVAFGGLRRR
jgi:hypothetical protein